MQQVFNLTLLHKQLSFVMKQFPMDPANIKHLILQVDVETSSLERNVIYSQKNF